MDNILYIDELHILARKYILVNVHNILKNAYVHSRGTAFPLLEERPEMTRSRCDDAMMQCAMVLNYG